MDFNIFKANVKVLDKWEGDRLRSDYIKAFINTEHKQYQQQIQLRHKFCDGYCYLGYLWDYIKNPVMIQEEYFNRIASQMGKVLVFWDIHSCEKIFIKDYWKFPKDAVIEIGFDMLLAGEEYLPEDFYIFDETMTWTLIKTHEDIHGDRYCLKSGMLESGCRTNDPYAT